MGGTLFEPPFPPLESIQIYLIVLLIAKQNKRVIAQLCFSSTFDQLVVEEGSAKYNCENVNLNIPTILMVISPLIPHQYSDRYHTRVKGLIGIFYSGMIIRKKK